MGIVGAKACGKSSLIKMMTMETPASQQSKHMLLQKACTEFDIQDEGIDLGLCTQNNLVNDLLTVKENLAFIGGLKGLTKEECENNSLFLMWNLEINHLSNVKGCDLSHNDKRRVTFAMSLIIWPKIEFLDQPFTGVDPCSQRGMIKTIRQI